jgi:uncharacterized phage protein (TIGR02220 family)
MANQTIKGTVFGDWEYQALAAELGLAMPADAFGRVSWLVQWCLDKLTPVAPRRLVEMRIGPGGADALIACDLGEEVEGGGILVKPAIEQVDQWTRRLKGNRTGGLNRAETAQRDGWLFCKSDDKRDRSTDSCPVMSETAEVEVDTSSAEGLDSGRISPSPSSSPSASPSPPASPEEGERDARAPAAQRSPSPSKGRAIHQLERAAAMAVLAKLGEQTGTDYRGSDKHTRLILGRYRDGFDELDLRKVIAYVARTKQEGGLGWQGDDKMRPYLRPETLFGPDTIERYVDAARSWFAKKVGGDPQPSPEFVAWRESQGPPEPRLRVVRSAGGDP